MTFNHIKLNKFAVILAVVTGASITHADTSTTIQVSAQIKAGCSFNQVPGLLDLGEQPSNSTNTVSAQFINGASNWALRCTNGTKVNIKLDGGKNAQSGQRNLKGPGSDDLIPYSLYTDPTFASPIVISGSRDITTNSSATYIPFNVYARANLATGKVNKTPGLYTDTIVVLFTW